MLLRKKKEWIACMDRSDPWHCHSQLFMQAAVRAAVAPIYEYRVTFMCSLLMNSLNLS